MYPDISHLHTMCNISFYAFAFLYVKISSVFNVVIISIQNELTVREKKYVKKPSKLAACLLEMTPLPTDFSQIHTLHFFGIAAPWDFVFMHYN